MRLVVVDEKDARSCYVILEQTRRVSTNACDADAVFGSFSRLSMIVHVCMPPAETSIHIIMCVCHLDLIVREFLNHGLARFFYRASWGAYEKVQSSHILHLSVHTYIHYTY